MVENVVGDCFGFLADLMDYGGGWMCVQNERLRCTNFVKGKDVMKDLLYSLGKS